MRRRRTETERDRLDAIEAELERLAGTDPGGDRILYGRVGTSTLTGTYPKFLKVLLDKITGTETAGGAAAATATGGSILGVFTRQPAASARSKCYEVSGGYACKELAAAVAGTLRTIRVRGCNNSAAQGAGATVVVTGPSPATDTVISGTTDGSGEIAGTLANGTYSYTVTPADSRYAAATGTFTHSGVGTTDIGLAAASGYRCACPESLCASGSPWKDTLLLTNDVGSATLTWDAARQWYHGCHDLPMDVASGKDPATSNCTGIGPGSTTIHWFYGCSGCFPMGPLAAGCTAPALVGVVFRQDSCGNPPGTPYLMPCSRSCGETPNCAIPYYTAGTCQGAVDSTGSAAWGYRSTADEDCAGHSLESALSFCGIFFGNTPVATVFGTAILSEI